MKRRTFLAAGAATGTVFASGCLDGWRERSDDGSRGAVSDDPAYPIREDTPESWTVAVVPDTQNYAVSAERSEVFESQISWLLEHAEAERIAFVTHEGDVVSDGSEPDQWVRMESLLGRLDGEIPYSVSVGDHDYAVEEDRASGADEFRARFGPERFADREYFGGAGPRGLSSYQQFTGGPYTFLHLNLEWEAPGETTDPGSTLG